MKTASESTWAFLPKIPGFREQRAWIVPSTPEQQNEAAARAIAEFYDTPQPERLRDLAPLLGRYKAAELAYAVSEMPYDVVLDEKRRYRSPLSAADFERIIGNVRRLVQQLQRTLSERERNALVETWPRHLVLDDFECCGFEAINPTQPRFRYTGNRGKKRPPIAAYIEAP